MGKAMSYRSASASSVRSMVSGIGAWANTLWGCAAMVSVFPLYQDSRPRPPDMLV